MTLSVSKLRFSYGRHPVLADISFDLPAGVLCGVLGVNGAGKSTLLKCLNRVLPASGGGVRLNGRELTLMTRREIARHVAYVPQDNGPQHLPVFDTVLLGRKPYFTWAPRGKDIAVVEKLLTSMHLSHLALRPASRLSGGELQKVLIARALAQEPKLLLMDEPTSSLDLKNQIEVMELLAETVSGSCLTAVVTLHDMNLALRYADYLLMLKDGRVHAFCPGDEVTPEMIRQVYGVDVALEQIRGQAVVVPVNSRPPVALSKCV